MKKKKYVLLNVEVIYWNLSNDVITSSIPEGTSAENEDDFFESMN